MSGHHAPGAATRDGRLLHRLDAWDLALYRRVARAHLPLLDPVLPRLTRAADHAVLWVGLGAGLAVVGRRRDRRAALRGLASLAVASAVTNVPAKLLTRRNRPNQRPVPLVRHLTRQPVTTSFPSGHSASAAAFTLGVATERPLLALPLGVLAAGVAYGRVHTGVHYPGDVAAGLLLGAGAALVVRRVWPVAPSRADVSRTYAAAPALPEGAGLTMIVNQDAGDGEHTEQVLADLAEYLPAARVLLADADHIEQSLRQAAEQTIALGVAGGDGTVNTAAALALEHGLPLVVVPAGTLNHFAGELGIDNVADLAQAVAEGQAVRICVASTDADGDGHYFLNTFSMGVYPDLVRERERHQEQIGKWPAMALAAARVLPDATPIRLHVDGQDRTVWTLFAGNGRYHPSGFAPTWRERLDDGIIDLRLIDAARPLARTRLVAAVLTGRLGRSRVYEQRVVAELDIDTPSTPLRVARDGEVFDATTAWRLRAADRTLTVYRPQ